MTTFSILIVIAIITFILWVLGGRLNFPGEVKIICLVAWITCFVIIIVLLVFGRIPLRL